MRYTARSTVAARGRSSPVTASSTARPAAQARSTSSAGVPVGSSVVRRISRVARSSRIASPPASWMASSAGGTSSPRLRARWTATPAWSLTIEMLWVRESCNSRAIRRRSSPARRNAASSRVRSASRARCSVWRRYACQLRSARPVTTAHRNQPASSAVRSTTCWVVGPGREVRHQEHPAAHGRRAAVSRAGRRVHGREDGQTGDGPRVGVQDVGRLGRRGHREDRPRRRLVEGEGRRREGHQRVVDGCGVRVEGRDGHDEGADHDREGRVGEPPAWGHIDREPAHVCTVDRRADTGVSPVDNSWTTPPQ